MSRFNFTGKLRYNTSDKQFSSFREGKTKAGDPYKSATFFINPAENNSGVVELFGMKTAELKVKDGDGNDLTVKWSDREDEDTIKKVANYRKNIIATADERKEFISAYDAIGYIEDNIDEFHGKVVTVTGSSQANEYNGTISDRFQIRNIYVVAEDKVNEKKQGLFINDTIYLTKDSIDLADFKNDGKIGIDAYTKEWISKDVPSAYIAKRFVIDCSKIDWDNEDHCKAFAVRFGGLGLSYEGGKVKCSLKSGKVYSMAVNIRLINGSEEISFDENSLTEAQRDQIRYGIKTLDDFKPRGNIYGERIKEYKIFACDLSSEEYSEGKPVELDMKLSEFEDEVYSASKPEKKDKEAGDEIGMNKPMSNDDGDDDSLEDLFS